MATAEQKKQFLEKTYPYAVKSANILKAKGIEVDPLFIVAQWSHETGYGTNKGTKNNNLAGVYAYPSSPYGEAGKKYDTLDDFIIDYTATLSNKRYRQINNAGSVQDFARGLKAGGYASDPDYAYAKTWTEAIDLMSQVNLKAEEQKLPDNSTKNAVKWWELYRIDPTTGQKVAVPWKNFFLGTTIETTEGKDGKTDVVIKDNTKLDTDPTKETVVGSADKDWFSFAKLGLFQVMVFILVLFFLYGALINGSTVDKIAKKFI